MPPDQLAGLGKFYADYAGFATFVLLMACLAFLFLIVWGRRFINQLKQAVESIDTLVKTHTDEKGNIVVSHYAAYAATREMLVEIKTLLECFTDDAKEHYSDVARLTDEEHWKNCPVDKCPHLPKSFAHIFEKIQGFIARFETYEILSTESRNRTNEVLDKQAEELQSLAREIIATLRSVRDERPNGRTK